MSDVSKRANLAVASIRAFCSHHQTLTAVASGVAALLGFSYPALARNYQAFKDLGQGALPVNVFGWAVACMLKPFEGDALSTEPYDRKGPSESWLGSPEEFPYRHGPRPKLGWHFPPQRQVDQIPTEQMKERIMQVFLKAASENLQQLRVGASEAERTDAALFIKGPSPHQTASAFKSEIGHVHAVVDYSMHFVLSPTDCKTVMQHGWGQRHPLGGTRMAPVELMLIYAPRDEEELAVVERIMRASIGFMTNTGARQTCTI